jgi:plastocyanin
MPGDSWEYEYEIPLDHPTGLFWYHPHHHGHAKNQTQAGLAGAIIIADGIDEPPEVTGARAERLLMFQHLVPGAVPDVSFYLNGQNNPVISIAEGESQLWRIVNASADDFFNLRVQGHGLRRVGIDGNWIPGYQDAPELNVLPLGPAERADVLITGGSELLLPDENERLLEVRSLRKTTLTNVPVFDEEFLGDDPTAMPFDVIATLKLTKAMSSPEGVAGTPEAGVPTSVVDLRGVDGVVERTIRFQVKRSPVAFVIDSRNFNADRIDQTVALDAVEEWTIVNESTDSVGWHPFHLHVNDFDVIETSHAGLQPHFYQDTIPLPPATDLNGPGWVRFRTRFADFTGRFVYHCHFLDHEDKGMMGVVEVVQPVTIVTKAFDPPSVTIRAGTTVLWTNHDATEHTVSAGSPRFNSEKLANGQSFTFTFDAPGTYQVKLGDDALGTVTVEETRSIAIVDNAFEPADLHVSTNTTVVWTNRDDKDRAVTATDGTFASGPLERLVSFRHTFTTAGTFAYQGEGEPPTQGMITVSPSKITDRESVWIGDDGFVPSSVTLSVNGTVSWTNRASRAHTVTANDGPLFDSGRLDPELPFSPGQRFSQTFDVPGTYYYHSALSMRGRITVVNIGPSGDASVDIDDLGFMPDDLTITTGAAVIWTNRGSQPHNVTIVASDGATSDSGKLEAGQSFSHTFSTRGNYSYHDVLQPSIQGEVVVT